MPPGAKSEAAAEPRRKLALISMLLITLSMIHTAIYNHESFLLQTSILNQGVLPQDRHILIFPMSDNRAPFPGDAA